MRKPIEFQKSTNNTVLLTTSRNNPYEDLVLSEAYRQYRHRFEAGKTKIRLLPALQGQKSWLLKIPALRDASASHAHPRAVKAGSQSVYDIAYNYLLKKHPDCLFRRANKSGFRLLPSAMALCWAIVQDENGIKLRLLLCSGYDGTRGGAIGLGQMIYNEVLRAGEHCDMPGHPLNPDDGVSLVVERIGGSDAKYPSYRLGLADDRGPLQPIFEKITEMEHNSLVPLEQTIRILDPVEEWQLLGRVIGHDLVAEIRSAHENFEMIGCRVTSPCAAESNRIEDAEAGEAFPVDGAAGDPDAYHDFPAKWEF